MKQLAGGVQTEGELIVLAADDQMQLGRAGGRVGLHGEAAVGDAQGDALGDAACVVEAAVMRRGRHRDADRTRGEMFKGQLRDLPPQAGEVQSAQLFQPQEYARGAAQP